MPSKATKKNTFPHVKIVMAGLLSTKSLVRKTADIIYHAKYPSQQARNKAVMAYLHSLGVPNALIFDDFSNLFETVFPDVSKEGDDSPFPINIDYDQDNCQYNALVAGSVDLDNNPAS